MTHLSFALGRRRLASLSLLVVLGASLVGPATVGAADLPVDAATVNAEEAHLISFLNADRAALGLVPVRVDARLMAMARARSTDMIVNDYFSHTQPDGRNVFDILNASGITWYGAGEIIAWNNYPMDVSASTANHQWLDSPDHLAILTSNNYNYVGVGLAVDPVTGKKMWTAIYMKGPDRTGAQARLGTPSLGTGTRTTRRVTLRWTGSDVRLQVLTAGLRSFVLQRKVDSGVWRTILGTTNRSLILSVAKGHRTQFRVAARDRAGNRGAWSTVTVNLR
ncbi:MAG TPA: CAP domain-containing protein [Candidatus Bathyarchaeia archaeon]|nr:CAP domain-containing protein [Candidatus Bathyarchaeia archaeon]